MEYLLGGDLSSALQHLSCFDEEYAKIYAFQIIQAFEYLHNQNFIHRDLKPENILVKSEGNLKLTDFCLSFYGDEDSSIEVLGTPGYFAPEILSKISYPKNVDF
jgi:serine/threonine protein kinase